MFRVSDCVVRFGVPEPTEWQRIGDEIDAAFVFAKADFGATGHDIRKLCPTGG
jgi:hypothetical protein